MKKEFHLSFTHAALIFSTMAGASASLPELFPIYILPLKRERKEKNESRRKPLSWLSRHGGIFVASNLMVYAEGLD